MGKCEGIVKQEINYAYYFCFKGTFKGKKIFRICIKAKTLNFEVGKVYLFNLKILEISDGVLYGQINE